MEIINYFIGICGISLKFIEELEDYNITWKHKDFDQLCPKISLNIDKKLRENIVLMYDCQHDQNIKTSRGVTVCRG
jgi:hypothetical protein